MRCFDKLVREIQLARTARALIGTNFEAAAWAGTAVAMLIAIALVFVAFSLAKPQVRSRKTKSGASLLGLIRIPFRGLPVGVGVIAGHV